jgi:hypothetical protein
MTSLAVLFKINASKVNQRFYIFTRLQLGEELKQIHAELFSVYTVQT